MLQYLCSGTVVIRQQPTEPWGCSSRPIPYWTVIEYREDDHFPHALGETFLVRIGDELYEDKPLDICAQW